MLPAHVIWSVIRLCEKGLVVHDVDQDRQQILTIIDPDHSHSAGLDVRAKCEANPFRYSQTCSMNNE